MEAKVSFPFSAKITVIYTFLMTALFAAAFILISSFANKSIVRKAFIQNETVNSRTALAVQNEISKHQEEAINLINTADYLSIFSSETFEAEFYSFLENYFSLNGSIYFIYSDLIGLRINETNLKKDSESEQYFSRWASSAADGLYNISAKLNQPVLALVFTTKKGHVTQKSAVAFSSRHLISVLSSGELNSSILLDSTGNILAAQTVQSTVSGASHSGFSYTESILSNSNHYFNFTGLSNDSSTKILYTVQKIAANNYYAITMVEEPVVTDIADKVKILVILLYAVVLATGILLIKKSSRKFIAPIEHLVEAMRFISAGRFNIELPVKTRDETAVLTDSFNKMALSLEDFKEKEQISDKKSIKEDFVFDATVMQIKLENFYFADENENSETAQNLLETYLKEVSECVSKGNGRIVFQNNYTVTCVWMDSDFNDSPATAAWNATKTTFMLRYRLFVINKDRKEHLKKPLRFNIGLSTGPFSITKSSVSENKNANSCSLTMYYADCAAELNKVERTDIILEKSTWNYVKEKVISVQIEEEKTDFAAQKYFAAINAAGMKGPQNLRQLTKVL